MEKGLSLTPMKKGRFAKTSSIGGSQESPTKDGMQISSCKENSLMKYPSNSDSHSFSLLAHFVPLSL